MNRQGSLHKALPFIKKEACERIKYTAAVQEPSTSGTFALNLQHTFPEE